MEEHTSIIRDFINNPRRQYGLLKNRTLWFQLCSSLDVIGDTQLAVDSYEAGQLGASDGARYLAVYGLLQALVVQQDAVLHLCESLKIPQTLDDHPRLREIREIRIESVGHPTKKRPKKGDPTSYHFIARITLTHAGFMLVSQYSDGRCEAKDVSTSDLIAEQRGCVRDMLTTVIEELEREEAAHKEKFRMEKLASFFPESLDYDCRKVLVATTEREDAVHAAASLHMIEDALHAFHEALKRRGLELDTYDSVKNAYGLVRHALGRLAAFFGSINSLQEVKMCEEDAHIFAFFVQQKIDYLRRLAREIDSDYCS